MSDQQCYEDMNKMRRLYSDGAGIRSLLVLAVMIASGGAAVAIMQGDVNAAAKVATEMKKENREIAIDVSMIQSDIRIIKDDQEEDQRTLAQHTRVLYRQTIILERIAAKMSIDTRTYED